MFGFPKKDKSPFFELPKGQRSVYENLHNLVLRLSGEQFALLAEASEKWRSIKHREFRHLFRKDAKLRDLFLECVALQCVILFRTACLSRYSDHADYITNGVIQEVAIHFSKSIRQDFLFVRNQITSNVEVLSRCKEFRSEEPLDAFKNSTLLGLHAAKVCALLDVAPFSAESMLMINAEHAHILTIFESKQYEDQVQRSAPAIVLSQL